MTDTLTDEQRGELHAWCVAEGIEVARARLTSDGAGRVLQRILDLARGAVDVPSEGPATSTSSSPVISGPAPAAGSDDVAGEGSTADSPPAAPPGAVTHEDPTQKGGGDDDSAGKGSPGPQPTAA